MSVPPLLLLIEVDYTVLPLVAGELSDPAFGPSILSSEEEWELLPSPQELPTSPRYRGEQVSHTQDWWQRVCKR